MVISSYLSIQSDKSLQNANDLDTLFIIANQFGLKKHFGIYIDNEVDYFQFCQGVQKSIPSNTHDISLTKVFIT